MNSSGSRDIKAEIFIKYLLVREAYTISLGILLYCTFLKN